VDSHAHSKHYLYVAWLYINAKELKSMKILHRYLTANFMWPLIFNTLIFISLFIVVDALGSLDDFISNETPLEIICLYYICMIPLILAQILPSSVLISALYSLSTMNKNNEISAMKAAGVSGYQILFPILYIGLLVSFGLLTMNEAVTPKSAITSTSIKQGLITKKGDQLSQRSINNVAIVTDGNRMIYARELQPAIATLYDVIILTHRNDMSIATKTTAARAVWQHNHWQLYEVLEYKLDQAGNIVGKPMHYPMQNPNIKETPEEFLNQYTHPEYMSYRNLKSYINKTKLIGYKISSRLNMELYQKIANPFICFIMLLVSAPLALKTQRGGAMKSIGVGLFVIVAYYSVIAFSSALGKGGAIPPLTAAWLPNGIFFIIGLSMIKKYL
jgi:lipopolysaccharide export system permease protein